METEIEESEEEMDTRFKPFTNVRDMKFENWSPWMEQSMEWLEYKSEHSS